MPVITVKVPACSREYELAGYVISHDVTLVLGQGLRANSLSPTEKMEGNVWGLQ